MSLEKSPGKAEDPELGPHPDLGLKKAKGPGLILGLDQGNLLRGLDNKFVRKKGILFSLHTTSHSAYVATDTESNGARIDGF